MSRIYSWVPLLALLLTACGQLPAPVVHGGEGRMALPPLEEALPWPSSQARRRILSPDAILVMPQENLYQIARRHGIALRDLIDANRLSPPYSISPGQRLVLPSVRFHRVQASESLYAISRRYGVDMHSLVRLNRIRPPYHLSVGQKLRLPATIPTPIQHTKLRNNNRPEVFPGSKIVPKSKTDKNFKKNRPPSRIELAHPPARSSNKFLWPVRGRIAVGFGPRGKGLHNDGINILAQRGTPVHAAANGIVAYSGNELRGFGNLLLIRHAGGWTSAYAHNQVLLVHAGDRVRRGQIISKVGKSGSVRRPQLHFELRRGKRAVNPVRYMTRRKSRRSVG